MPSRPVREPMMNTGLPAPWAIAEAMLAIVLLDHALRHRGQNADVGSQTPVLPASSNG